MRSAARLDRISKKRSNVPGPSKKASHRRRPHKPFDPPPPSPLDPPSMRRAEHKARSEYNTYNPFDRDIPLHDVTGQPLRLPSKLIRCPSGGVIRAHVLYPTPQEFSKMHAVKPANRFGRGRNPEEPSSASASAPNASSPGPVASSADSAATGSDVVSLVEQLKAKGLEPEDEIMLAHLKQLDMQGQFREYYHNAAEACERAEALHPVHVKMVRYRGAMKTGDLSKRDYEQLKLEVEQRRKEQERLKAEEEARRRAEEERLQAELEAKQREEERLRAEEEAKQEERRRQEAEWAKRWQEEQHRLFMQRLWDEMHRQRARQAEIRRMEEEEEQRKRWEAQQVLLEEQRRHEEELRLHNEAIERERRNQELIRKWEERRRQEAMQAETERQYREYAERERLARELAERERRAAQEQAIARFKAETVASYEALWKGLRAKKYPPESLSYANFPFPVFASALMPRPDAFTHSAVAEFVLSPLRADAALRSRKARIKAELLLWHSDKFTTEVLPIVHEFAREDVETAARNITQLLNEMLSGAL